MIKRSELIKESVLKYWLLTPKEDLFHIMRKHVRGEGEERHIYIDNNASILCVAHLDTVCPLSADVKLTQEKIVASGLDDRLGAYMCAIMPTLGINVDILFTDNEEVGRSTAQYFNTDKRYKWVVEFDRMGDDIVTYGLDSPAWVEQIEATGAKKGFGSFSDLCYLKLPGSPCMLNVGIGYYQPHQPSSYAQIRELLIQTNRFKVFYERNKDKAFTQESTRARHKGAMYEQKELIADELTDEEEAQLALCEQYENSVDTFYECYYCGEIKLDKRPFECDSCGAENSYIRGDISD